MKAMAASVGLGALALTTVGISNGPASSSTNEALKTYLQSRHLEDLAPLLERNQDLLDADAGSRLKELGLEAGDPTRDLAVRADFLIGQWLAMRGDDRGAPLVLRSGDGSLSLRVRMIAALTEQDVEPSEQELDEIAAASPDVSRSDSAQAARAQNLAELVLPTIAGSDSNFAGGEIRDGRLVIRTAGSVEAVRAIFASSPIEHYVTVEKADYSVRQISNALDLLQAAIAGDATLKSAIDALGNRGDGTLTVYPRLSVPAEAVQRALDRLQAMTSLKISLGDAQESEPATVRRGGVATAGSCTWGFTANDDQLGGTVMLTAAHCSDGQGTGWTFRRQAGYEHADAQIHSLPSGDTGDNQINLTVSPYYADITARSNYWALAIGQTYCKQGRTTGNTCGQVSDLDYRPGWVYNPSAFIRLSGSTINSDHGDSGGPVYSGNTAVGLVAGSVGPNPYGRNDMVFGAINFAESYLGVTVLTK
jgi:hypothetical protein